ncbi:Na(+)-translocating NADH-quinone reductase subunit A [Desulfopila sp. IMCC35008]|uniref:Na(+)-translocating NADH-quinone reductase subunit A n=1 Tax=Desulfopila sp. IMCC35008 TaxID=2653858 RepID=UPI0013D88E6E|nr:Na(+)-translocating NADH-quinone reductase subunit A [Desulfopila sp. IMCC35008]
MKHFDITKGLDIPISGKPDRRIADGTPVTKVALVGDDSIGLKPTMEVQVGDSVITGQLLFTDKKTEGVKYTSPGCGTVLSINRGPKRKFESIVLELEGDEKVIFINNPAQPPTAYGAQDIRSLLVESGLWTSLRTRPFGKVPGPDSQPAALFITAMESEPLAPDTVLIIKEAGDDYQNGLQLLRRLLDVPIHYCSEKRDLLSTEQVEGLNYWTFTGPHPAGLPSTHIHLIDPVHEEKTVWQIGYQEVAAIGSLFRTGTLPTERVVTLAGPGVTEPSHVRTRIGADLFQLCNNLTIDEPVRVLSGSVLSGRTANGHQAFLGRCHNQVSVLPDNSGRSLFNWAMPGMSMFSVKPVFTSALVKNLQLKMNTALWGGRRAIYPLGTYEDVMPLDIIPVYLLKALAVHDTEKSKNLGCLELVEEDLALCSFSCPGKNEFGPMLRNVLNTIELGG